MAVMTLIWLWRPNTLRESQGGLCTVENGKVLTLIPLPLAGLMCDLPPEVLLEQMEQFLSDCRRMGFNHQNLLTFFTLMPLADFAGAEMHGPGSVDALHKRLLPLIDRDKGDKFGWNVNTVHCCWHCPPY